MKYLHWNEQTVTDFSVNNITDMYEKGYVFTRIGKGVMQQTRSLRIDLSRFELSSENRRILKKLPDYHSDSVKIPLSEYDFSIGKMAKDFYDTKFGSGIMSAQKIKEMLTDADKSNFNLFLQFHKESSPTNINEVPADQSGSGYTICYMNDSILHYSYPFYDLEKCSKDTGLAMMIKAINFAKESGLKYIYLGSLQRPTDVYKLQFAGLEWFDGKVWSTDLNEAKKILSEEVVEIK
jgi:arginyl-tRNA--protein-N-Asp/Glu arginylyltransferase